MTTTRLASNPGASAAAASAAAKRAGLRWVSDTDTSAGLRRKPHRDGFSIVDARGKRLTDSDTLARIRKLAIPPAWTDVWISPHGNGHLQATGRDARGRKQYRYHADWVAGRGDTKFERLLEVAQALPRIRSRVRRVLATAGNSRGALRPGRELVLATLVQLLDSTWLRIGNAEYARANRSFGLSTLRNQHARVAGQRLLLRFIGKSGVAHEAEVTDARVARVVRKCRDLPGQDLFQFVDDDGTLHKVGSADVNDWLRACAGTSITAKDFRTWHGSVFALDLILATLAGAPHAAAAAVSSAEVLRQVAKRLGNTPAVCKKAYVHPDVMALGDLLRSTDAVDKLRSEAWVQSDAAGKPRGLSRAELRLTAMLRSKQARPRPRSTTPPAAKAAQGSKAATP